MGLDQEYEMKELKERRKLQMRNKAVKKGIQRPSVVPTLPRYTCSPNTRDVQTPERTETVRSCMKVVLRFSEPSGWRPCGRRSWESGTRDLKPNCPSGAVSDLVRRREIQRLQRVRRRLLMMVVLRRNMKRKRRITRRRKRNKSSMTDLILLIHNIPYISLLPISRN